MIEIDITDMIKLKDREHIKVSLFIHNESQPIMQDINSDVYAIRYDASIWICTNTNNKNNSSTIVEEVDVELNDSHRGSEGKGVAGCP